MTDTLLNKISKHSNNTIITDAWLTGRTGEIVNIKGDCVFRFIDFIIDNGELRLKHTTDESKLTCAKQNPSRTSNKQRIPLKSKN